MPAKSTFTTRPVILARGGVVTSGHYLASAAGFRILAQGGNAIDAAAATCLVLTLVEPQNAGLGGEAPALIYSAKDRKVFSVCGMGWSPKAFTVDWCRQNGINMIPGDGYLPACVPATIDTWCLALARFGTMSFAQIAEIIDCPLNTTLLVNCAVVAALKFIAPSVTGPVKPFVVVTFTV